MPTAKALAKFVLGALVGLYLMAPAYAAFTPAQVPLLSASAVTPNVMLLVDNSGSMNSIIWESAFDPSITTRPAVSYYYQPCSNCNYYQQTLSGGDSMILTNAAQYTCSRNYRYFIRSNRAYCMLLPDPVNADDSSNSTRYSADYLSYLMDKIGSGGGTRDFSSLIPTDYRMRVARDVSTTLVTANRNLRIGLATFNPPKSSDSGPGGTITRVVSDLQAVSATTYQSAVSQKDADKNFSLLTDAIKSLTASANTPLAETYYEITRYFRGLTPVWGVGAPSTYTSPIQYRCQKNFGVVITDGLPTYDRTFTAADPDVTSSTPSLPNWDQVNNDGDAPLTGDGEGDSLFLDDIAKFAYDIDMRKDSSNPSTDLTKKSWDSGGFPRQYMSTYTVGFTANNQMLLDAANSTHGRGQYFQTNDSASLTTALNAALSDIASKIGSGASGAANSSTLQTGTQFYQTLYDPTDWHGTIRAFSVDASTGSVSGAALWDTDKKITDKSTAPPFQSWNTATSKVISLDYLAFSPAQQAALNATVPSSPAGLTGADLINWAKGTNKTGLRTRTKLLGDIVNSPLVPALPTDKTAADLTGDSTYTQYLSNKAKSMAISLVVNGNDGFVHVINPVDGTRRYAYMPSTVLTSIATLASSDYGVSKHRFTVDGQIAVRDTQYGGSWQTVAYGGLAAGGKALYAVQLFDGDNNIKALWEVRAPDSNTPANDFNDLGYTYSRPEVARMGDSAGTGIVVIGNGYGNFAGTAALYVLNAKTGALIRKISVPAQTGETDNGLSSVALQVNAQNVVQAAYAGDLKGRLWKFDLSSASSSAWGIAYSGKPLFTASGGANQPITAPPLLFDHPQGGKLVEFGTGKFSETSDKTTTAQQKFYAIWDGPSTIGGIVETNLQQQAIAETKLIGGNTYYTTTSSVVDWNNRQGWYFPLSAVSPWIGERIIYPAQTSRGRIIFTTAAVNSADPCESTGTGRLFELDAVTGSMLSYPVLDTNNDGVIGDTDGLVSGFSVGTGIPNLVSIVSGTGSANDNKYVLDSSGNAATRLIEKGGTANVYQRIMWRQIQ